jgi:hypothetical protein
MSYTSPSPTEFWVTLCVPEPILFRKIVLPANIITQDYFFLLKCLPLGLHGLCSSHMNPASNILVLRVSKVKNVKYIPEATFSLYY